MAEGWAIGTYYDENDNAILLGHYRDSDVYYLYVRDEETGETRWELYEGVRNNYPSTGSGSAYSSSSSGYRNSTTTNVETTYISSVGSTKENPATVSISVSGFLKKEIYRITAVQSGDTATIELEPDFVIIDGSLSGIDGTFHAANITEKYDISLWSMGAWGGVQGYPCAVAMYQDRLILAGSNLQPQTIWMSRTGDYADFGISDPLKDDDAVNITLAGSRADRIHSLTTGADLLVFTIGGEWKVKGSGDSGTITPTALTAHQQTNIGTKNLQPLTAGGHMILVQSQGKKVYALGYDLSTDGYTGSELTIMSSHIFEGKEIIDMAYQKEPDSLLWFVLSDGTCAVCTYNPEHEVIGWSRQEFGEGIAGIVGLTGTDKTEILCSGTEKSLMYMKDRTKEAGYTDWGSTYESRMRTLRLNVGSEDGSTYTSEKLASRLILSALRTSGAWTAPGDYSDEAHNWERRRRLEMDYREYLQDIDIQLDNGFSNDAAIQIRSADDKPLTIAGITPILTVGG